MKQLVGAVLLGSMVAAGPAFASAELATAKQCMQCHKVKEDFAGPSFHKIAIARKGEPDAAKRLAATIRKGSTGTGGPHWGKAKMPDQSERPLVSASEATTLAKWVLEQ